MNSGSYADNPVVKLTFDFALKSIAFAETLESERKYVIANQFLKSSTSIGANVKEAQGAESRQDFIHKMRIAYKEAEESEYWLLLCKHANTYPTNEELLEKVIEIKKILNKIIASSTKNKLLSFFTNLLYLVKLMG